MAGVRDFVPFPPPARRGGRLQEHDEQEAMGWS